MSVKKQIELEMNLLSAGRDSYFYNIKKSINSLQEDRNPYSRRLLIELLPPISAAIKEWCAGTNPGVKKKYRGLLRKIMPEKAAYFGLIAVLRGLDSSVSFTIVAHQIGQFIEDELKCKKFYAANPGYYKSLQRSFRKYNTHSYRHRRVLIQTKMNHNSIKWDSWTSEDRAAVGSKVIDFILQETDLIEKKLIYRAKNKKEIVIQATSETSEWVTGFNNFMSTLSLAHKPCIIPPKNWKSLTDGGYYHDLLREKWPLVRACKDDIQVSGLVLNAVNTLQKVPWKINTKLFKTLQAAYNNSWKIGIPRTAPYEIPVYRGNSDAELKEWKNCARVIYTAEALRLSKCRQLGRVLALAEEYKNIYPFWYVYYLDFRGRMYPCTEGLSPQGPDYAKALLLFADGKRLTGRGKYWLKIHGASCYGIDKCSYEDRVKWIDDHEQIIINSASDPHTTRKFWGQADKPWQFLAFCIDYQGVKRGKYSYLPTSIDGSCNGLQHFSALLRDEVGGKSVNLVSGNSPRDIYTEVAEIASNRILKDTSKNPECQLTKRFLGQAEENQLPRKLVKNPVMTLPYGSTKRGCFDYILDYIIDNTDISIEDRIKVTNYLTGIIWDSIHITVRSAKGLMHWLKDFVEIRIRANKPIIYNTPSGFTFIQNKKKTYLKRVNTELLGPIRIGICSELESLDIKRNKSGIVPNFIHSLDASHLVLCINECSKKGVNTFVAVHDSFGGYANDLDIIQECTKKTFVRMHKRDLLKSLWEQNYSGEYTPAPRGNLDINSVLSSEYFFN